MSIEVVTGDSSAADIFTRWGMFRDKFNFGVSGTWVGTVTLQRVFAGSTATIWDTDDFTANIGTFGYEPEDGVKYRAGFKAGAFVSGIASIRISQ